MDPAGATVIAAAVGAVAALAGTFITLVVTRWLDDRRWRREREHREVVERRAAYAKMLRTLVVWREATVELEGEPEPDDWEKYWAARHDALQAGAELEMIGSALAIESVDEALDQLLDASWDYEVNGPAMLESQPLWARIRYVDSRIDAFRDLARAEFSLEPERPDPRVWLETPELVKRRIDELRDGRARKNARESREDAEARLRHGALMHQARRAGTTRRLELDSQLSAEEAAELVDRWDDQAKSRGLSRDDSAYWREAQPWFTEQLAMSGRRVPMGAGLPQAGPRVRVTGRSAAESPTPRPQR